MTEQELIRDYYVKHNFIPQKESVLAQLGLTDKEFVYAATGKTTVQYEKLVDIAMALNLTTDFLRCENPFPENEKGNFFCLNPMLELCCGKVGIKFYGNEDIIWKPVSKSVYEDLKFRSRMYGKNDDDPEVNTHLLMFPSLDFTFVICDLDNIERVIFTDAFIRFSEDAGELENKENSNFEVINVAPAEVGELLSRMAYDNEVVLNDYSQSILDKYMETVHPKATSYKEALKSMYNLYLKDGKKQHLNMNLELSDNFVDDLVGVVLHNIVVSKAVHNTDFCHKTCEIVNNQQAVSYLKYKDIALMEVPFYDLLDALKPVYADLKGSEEDEDGEEVIIDDSVDELYDFDSEEENEDIEES